MASRAARGFLFALVFCAVVLRGDTETAQPTHATIRGSGNDVAIVYRGSAANSAAAAQRASGANGVLTEAIRQAAGGAGDESLIAYLRNHQTGLPAIVAAEDVRRLRTAGAGAPVISYLSGVTALDIGETAEGGAATPTVSAPQQAPSGRGRRSGGRSASRRGRPGR